ncbi:hypothetical protein DFH11DRAFT_1266156 [Phellopilus nigrolimitatus]|nr:hypothetical protein DFH11DRAFT_1266156 [Phellopilus nigrolimitatus]
MLFTTKSTFVLAAAGALLAVHAQSGTDTSSAALPTGTAGIDECIITCVSSAASSAGCSSFTDLSCICTSSAFQTSALQCLQSSCSAEDLSNAQALQQTECASVSGASSGASSATDSASGTSSSGASSHASSTATTPASSGASSSGAASSSSAASGKAVFGAGVATSVAVGFMGIVFGALAIV